jgi:enoyl-CoA hydratase/carnithine racemase
MTHGACQAVVCLDPSQQHHPNTVQGIAANDDFCSNLLNISGAVDHTCEGASGMPYEYIVTERHDGIAVITLNRPAKLNALSFGLMRELDNELTQIEDDEALKVVILTGAGERAFSAGADIHEMAGLSAEELGARQAFRNAATWHIANCTKPIIGAINGLAYGGAALLSSTLDLRIGCERTAFRFLAASYGRVNSTWSLPALVGLPKAKELLYTGRAVHAEEAEKIGLLNQVVPADTLRDAALDMARMIAGNDTRMVQGIKRLLHEDIGLGWQERYDNEEHARTTWLTSAHPREGFKDFLTRKGQRV